MSSTCDRGKASRSPSQVRAEDLGARPEFKNVAQQISGFGISPSAARAVVEARGNIFTVPAEHGSIRTLTTDNSSIHEMNPMWSPDGKWIAYLSDKTGEYEVYVRPQTGGDEIRVTTDGGVYRYGPVWSPDSKKLLYWDKLHRLWWVGTDDKKPVQVDQGDYGDIFDGVWAPDSRWLAYSKADRRGAGQLFLYSLDQKKTTKVSDGYYNDSGPAFDPEGKYLYFFSQRYFFPSQGQLDQRFNYYTTDGVFALTLKADETSPFEPLSDEEKGGADKDKDKAKDKDKDKAGDKSKQDEKKGDAKEEKKEEPPKPVQIDLNGIAARVAPMPIPSGMFGGLNARKGKLFYMSQPQEARAAGDGHDEAPKLSLHVYDLEKREDKELLSGIEGYALDAEGKKVLYKAGPVMGIVETAPGKKVGDGKLDLSDLTVRIDPRDEWKQTFDEAWRIERDFYWDPDMTGHDWKAIGKRYEALLPWLAHRSDLNYLIGEMISELSTSHTYVGGGDTPKAANVSVGMLAADFEPAGGYYRITKIYPGENWKEANRSPLTEPGLKVSVGDYLIAVNGQEAKAEREVYFYFQNLAGKLVTLKINGKPSSEGAWEIIVKPVADESGTRYLDWFNANRKKVEQATGGRVGYMYVPDTSIPGIIEFDKALNAQLGKDGIIIDERYNQGGNIPDFYTEKLKRQLLAVIAPRDAKDIPWPPVAIYGPKIMIVNELAGSGGDCFPWFFRREKIGPIVGTRTWGGLVGIGNNQPLRDGGYVTAPGFGFWSTDNGGESGRRTARRGSGLRRAAAARPGRQGPRPAARKGDRAGEGSAQDLQADPSAAEVPGGEVAGRTTPPPHEGARNEMACPQRTGSVETGQYPACSAPSPRRLEGFGTASVRFPPPPPAPDSHSEGDSHGTTRPPAVGLAARHPIQCGFWAPRFQGSVSRANRAQPAGRGKSTSRSRIERRSATRSPKAGSIEKPRPRTRLLKPSQRLPPSRPSPPRPARSDAAGVPAGAPVRRPGVRASGCTRNRTD